MVIQPNRQKDIQFCPEGNCLFAVILFSELDGHEFWSAVSILVGRAELDGISGCQLAVRHPQPGHLPDLRNLLYRLFQ